MPNENVYQKYLGITASGKPDHYALLGVPFKESNPEIIAAAARQRREILTLQETSDNQTEIKLLISEIKDARDTLLDDKKRKQYEFDFLLNRSVEEKNAASGPQQMEPMPDPTPAPASPSPAAQVSDPFGFASAPPAHGHAPAPGPNPFDFGAAPAPGPAPAADPFNFGAAPAPGPAPAPAADPFNSGAAPAPGSAPAPAADPFGFASAPAPGPAPAPAADPFGFASASAPAPGPAPAPAPAANPFGFNAQPAAPPQVNSYASAPPRSAGGYSGKSSSHGKAQKKDNTPLIIAIAGGVVILLLLLWNIGYNSPRKQAERLYNKEVTAVNSYRYDEARELLDLAIQLDNQEMYVKYRADIDRKQKNHEYTVRHRKAREADDEEFQFQ